MYRLSAVFTGRYLRFDFASTSTTCDGGYDKLACEAPVLLKRTARRNASPASRSSTSSAVTPGISVSACCAYTIPVAREKIRARTIGRRVRMRCPFVNGAILADHGRVRSRDGFGP